MFFIWAKIMLKSIKLASEFHTKHSGDWISTIIVIIDKDRF